MNPIEHLEDQARLGDWTPASMTGTGRQSADLDAADGAAPASADASEDDQQRSLVMQEFDVSYDGRSYHYNGYSYDALADAVGYAKLTRSQPAHENPVGPCVARSVVPLPSDTDRAVMTALGINFEAGQYRFGTFRYDRLDDAINYAESH